ncbi:hypothetical protein HUJ04_011462 [Dendroctonus ponderosae]|nr:hypothetical protein HUJ04_011462 [Dendroctonus ponderosae]
MKKEIRPENNHRRCWWQQHPVIKRKLGIIVMVAVVSRLKNTGKAAKMRRNVKIMLAFTVVWMFVIIYYLPRVADDGSKRSLLRDPYNMDYVTRICTDDQML